ncbi:MAG: hypothetical protein ACU0CO_04795 [Shimia sp.]
MTRRFEAGLAMPARAAALVAALVCLGFASPSLATPHPDAELTREALTAPIAEPTLPVVPLILAGWPGLPDA